MRSVYVKSVL